MKGTSSELRAEQERSSLPASTPDWRSKQIADLKERVKLGTYRVSSQVLADKFLGLCSITSEWSIDRDESYGAQHRV